MENKKKQQSLHSLIYVLLAAMLACVVFVSIYTVASRRHRDPADETSGDPAQESRTEDTQKKPGPSDSASAPDTDTPPKSPQEGTKPAETTAPSKPTGGDKASEIPASSAVRYYVMPVEGSMAKGFEIDIPVYSLTMNDYRAHTGVDFCAPIGSEVLSVSSGTVARVYTDPMMGQCVTVDHGDSIYSTYMNLAEELAEGIAVGTRVSMGQLLGVIGETSLVEIAEEPHLHLEMKIDGQFVDPLEYIGGKETTVYQD